MTIQDLIESLQNVVNHGTSNSAVVKTFEPESGQYEEVTGFTYDNSEVKFYTDVD